MLKKIDIAVLISFGLIALIALYGLFLRESALDIVVIYMSLLAAVNYYENAVNANNKISESERRINEVKARIDKYKKAREETVVDCRE